MRNFKRLIAIILVVASLCSFTLTASAADYTDSANDAATNWVTTSSATTMVFSRPMFDDQPKVTATDIGISAFESLTDIFTANGKIYVLDNGEKSARIVILDEQYKLLDEITSVTLNGEAVSFKGAKGIYADEKYLYICDTANSRVLICDEASAQVVDTLSKPTAETSKNFEMWPNDLSYNPTKMVVDNMGYLYVLCDGSFYGAVMYSPEYEFMGFFGANVVSTSVLDALNNVWDMLFQNNEKLSRSAKSLPFSFVDLVKGGDGYIYTCTGQTGRNTTAKGTVRRLNPTGSNILKDKTKDTVTDSSNVVFATSETSKIKGYPIAHDVCSISVDENNFIYVLDASYGRIYMYDTECNLLCTIGGGVTSGMQLGTFRKAVAISYMNGTIYAIDDTKKCLISFKLNDYGTMVQQAQSMTINGDYQDAAEIWQEVLSLDRNNILAYRGMAKASLLNDRYEEAMEYALNGYDRGTYSQAYEYVRKEFLSQNFTWIFIGAIVLVVALAVALHYKKKHKVVLIKNHKLKVALGTMLHPADTFYEIKRNNNGSVLIATLILALWYAFKIIGYTSGFIFNKTNIISVNAWYALAQTFGLVFLFVASNWLVCVLFEGKATLKQIYVATCYSIMPMVINAIGYDILANVLTLNEANFINILNYACIFYTAILLIMGIINVQEFGFGKFVFTTVVTVLAMILVVFLVFLVGILLQQAGNFVQTVFLEAFYR